MAANNVSVTLIGRDQLSAVLEKSNRSLRGIATAGKLLSGIGIARILLESANRAREFATNIGGNLAVALKDVEISLKAMILSLSDSTGATEFLTKATEYFGEVIVPRLIVGIKSAIFMFELMIEIIVVSAKHIYNFLKSIPFVGAAIEGLGRFLKNTGAAILEFQEVAAGMTQEQARALFQQNKELLLAEERAKAAAEAFKQYREAVSSLVSNLDALTQSQILNLRVQLEQELQLAQAQVDRARTTEELAAAVTRLAKAQQELQKINTPKEENAIELAVDGHATSVGKLIAAYGVYNNLNDETKLKLQELAAAELESLNATLARHDALSQIGVETQTLINSLSDAIGKATEVAQTEAQKKIEELAASITDTIETTLGGSIYNAMSRAFSGEGLGGLLRGFGSTILAGLGDIFVQLGQSLIKFGALMEKLKAFLFNPLTSGPASIAAGLALIALGGVLGGIATRTGGAGVGFSTQPSLQAGTLGQQNLNQRGMGEATLIINGGLLDMSDPRQAAALANAIGELSGRRVIVTGA